MCFYEYKDLTFMFGFDMKFFLDIKEDEFKSEKKKVVGGDD